LHAPHDSKLKFEDVAITLIRQKGYDAMTVDDVCAAAGLTKGSFFHHFKSKEDLALGAVTRWNDVTGNWFRNADYHRHSDPLDRLLAYIELRKEMLRGETHQFTCLLGTMLQEIYATRPMIRDACGAGIHGHAATLQGDISEARALYAVGADWSAESLCLHTQAVIQGAFLLAKTTNGPELARDCLDHLRRYIERLFPRAPQSCSVF
jgi:TetR/AcrR family transcriptional repressor of nem operon